MRQEAEGKTRCYWDPALKGDKDVYLDFVKELRARGMIEFHRSCECRAGIFFVTKKSGKLRLVVDARGANQMLRTPPCTSLASTAAVCEFEGSPDGVWFSGQDIADCFYQFRIPFALQRYFGLRPVRATDLGLTHVGGHRLPLNALVLPCLAVLPMGFSWALHWTQEAHRFLIDQAGL